MGKKDLQAAVDTPCLAYEKMSRSWTLIDDLIGGSQAMRDNSSVYLPKFTKEKDDHYQSRVAGSFLFSAYGDTVKRIMSKPFSRPVTLNGSLPEPLDSIAEDTDDQGKSIDQLGKDILNSLINRGKAHILVDYPVTVSENGTTPNLLQERQLGLKPRLLFISADQLIGWQVTQDKSGKPYLSRIRISETKIEPSGDWGEQEVQYIRVIEPTKWQLWRKVTEKEGKVTWEIASEGINSLGKIPLVTVYANQTSFMTADPPLKELSEMNLTHYRSDSDQRNILHMARTVTLFAKGLEDEEADKIALGPNQIVTARNPEADVKFIEHTGSAIQAGKDDIEKLEERMVILGLQPFLRRLGNQTATGQSIDENRATCDTQAWVMATEIAIYQAYVLAGEWINVTLPDDFNIIIFKDFSLWTEAAQHISDLIKMRQIGELSRPTFLQEIKRRGLLSDAVDVEQEVANIESEGPSLSMIGLGIENQQDNSGQPPNENPEE